jgi:hypothetical protein
VIQGVKAQSSSNIYINPDDSISGTPSMQRNGDRYTLTANIHNSPLVITCNNIVVDGGGFSLQSAGGWGTAE